MATLSLLYSLAARFVPPYSSPPWTAVELELGSVSKELETINVDKLDLLTSKVKINKGRRCSKFEIRSYDNSSHKFTARISKTSGTGFETVLWVFASCRRLQAPQM